MTPQPASMGWFQASPDPDSATAETIGFMCKLIARAAKDPGVQALAAVADTFPNPAGGGGNAAKARSVFWWAKHFIERVSHSQFKSTVQAFPEKRQLLIDPCALVTMAQPAGDCSVFSAMIAALLTCLGIRYELVTVGVDPSDPSNFTHVYPRAVLEDGSRLALDANAGPSPGWQVPDSDVLRSQVWDASGTAVPDEAVRPSALGQYVGRGLGDDYDDGATTFDPSAFVGPLDPVDTSAFVGPSSYASGVDANGYYTDANGWTQLVGVSSSSGSSYSGPSYTAPSQSSSGWAAFATAMAKGGMQLAEINAIQPGTVVGANGQILRQATGIAVPGSSGITASLGGSTGTLMLAAVAAVVLVMVMGKK